MAVSLWVGAFWSGAISTWHAYPIGGGRHDGFRQHIIDDTWVNDSTQWVDVNGGVLK